MTVKVERDFQKKSIDARLGTIESQIRKLFNLVHGIHNNQTQINNIINGPTNYQLTHAHEWRRKREETKPPRQSAYGAVYYRPNDIDEILAEYLISQQP